MNKRYEVWVLGYTQDEMITDYSELLFESYDKNEAMEYAKNMTEEFLLETISVPEGTDIINMIVETVVDKKDCSVNVETLYENTFRHIK